jgi:hypothetical protein
MSVVYPSPATPPSHSFGRARRSPAVQALQSTPDWIKVYSGSPPPSLNLRKRDLLSPSANQTTTDAHGHPHTRSRWTNPTGWGARHVSDLAPFSLWDEKMQKFNYPTKTEYAWIETTYEPIYVLCQFPLIIITTKNPPIPVPLTLGCVAVVFCPSGLEPKFLAGNAPCIGPRLPDPCTSVRWPHWGLPTKIQMIEVVEALCAVAQIRSVSFLPPLIVVELVSEHDQKYPPYSLPGIVAGKSTTYHDAHESFFQQMKVRGRERLMDPQLCLPNPIIGPAPQDGTDYLNEPEWGFLSPGMRVSASDPERLVSSTTLGTLLRKGGLERCTVADHGFLRDQDIFHPDVDGTKIGEVTERYPEFDIAMVKLNPSHTFTNGSYFQGEPPKRLVASDEIGVGAFYEVEGMSTGLMTLMHRGRGMKRPIRPIGHPKVPVTEWNVYNVNQVFGASSPELIDGLCGAPMVGVDTGNVAGFFHMAAGDFAISAALDDLVAEGWGVV